jgi:Ca2+-binding EF-hand superfamily protein
MSLLRSARRAAAVFACCALTVGAVPASEPAPGAEAAFQAADTNKDGKLSKEEASQLPAIAARFEELDRNKDGFLSLEEFMTGYTA